MALVYDLADPVELQGYIRNIDTGPLVLTNNVLPPQYVDDVEYAFMRGDLTQMDIAPFRAFDTEAPIGTRPGVARVSGELPPISKKIPLTEEQRLRLRALQRGGTVDLANRIFDDAGRLALAVAQRLELAAGQSIDTGVLTINENGLQLVLDYGYATAQKPVLTGTARFTDPSADILGWYAAQVQAYMDRNGGQRPGYAVTSTKVRNAMLTNTVIRNFAFGGTTGAASMPLPADRLPGVLASFELPPIRLYDTTVPVGGVATRPIRDTSFVLMPAADAGQTFYGVTAEALELVDARQIGADLAPGMVAVNDRTFDPVQTWTKVAAIALPTLTNPSLITAATVI